MTATDLLVDLARIQAKPSMKREVAAKWKGHKWSNEELAQWARWNWVNALKGN